MRAAGADCVVSLGGGSTIGLGKAIAVRTGADQVAVPTTYAGSEMTDILGETAAGRKTTRRDPAIRPETVIYDVALTLGLPPALTATSGLNALAHAVEALYAPDRNPVLTLFAARGDRGAGRGAAGAGRRARATARRARGRSMAPGSAARRSGGTTMALHHKLCHVLGGSFGLPHSETHAVILPHAAAYNARGGGRAARAGQRGAGRGRRRGEGCYDLARADRRAAGAAGPRPRRGRPRPGGRPRDGEPLLEPAAGRARRRSAALLGGGLGGRAAGGMSLAGREIAVVGGGIGGARGGDGAGAARRAGACSSSRRRRSPRWARACRSRRTAWRCWRRSGSAPAAAERWRACPRRWSCATTAPGGWWRGVPLGAAAVARYGRPYWQFHRADLLAVLAARRGAAGVELRLGHADRRRSRRGAPGVRLAAESGAGHDAEIAVAADGLRSGLRVARVSRPRRRASPGTWPGAGWCRPSGCRRRRRAGDAA